MNLVEIGKFIAQLRKEKGYTQEQFGDKIGVTNKTVSRWETGTYLPPADALLLMSDLFEVSVNEILSGKRLTAEEYKAAAEDNLTQTIKASSFSLKDKIDFYKKKWLKDHLLVMIIIGAVILVAAVCAVVLKESLLGYVTILLIVLAHGWRNNTMMAYVEKNAYNGDVK